MMELLIPLLFLLAGSFAIARRQDVYAALLSGAQRGLRLLATLAPTLIVLLSVVTFLRQSGFFELLSTWLRPLFSRLGIPAELAPLMLIRPLSGSAALAVGTDLMRQHGVDSLIGKTAAVMLGSSETTFYTIRRQADTLCHPRRALCRRDRFFLCGAVCTAVFLLKFHPFSVIVLGIMSEKGELSCKFL